MAKDILTQQYEHAVAYDDYHEERFGDKEEDDTNE